MRPEATVLIVKKMRYVGARRLLAEARLRLRAIYPCAIPPTDTSTPNPSTRHRQRVRTRHGAQETRHAHRQR